jgi:predicted nuclease with RNAse H fold
MERPFRTFLGVDLGGGKGKTTAVARLEVRPAAGPDHAPQLEVVEVGTTHQKQPWYDAALIEYLGSHADGAVIAMNAPLTLPACVRCREPVCPGMAACVDPAIVWFRTAGAELIAQSAAADRDRIVAVPANGKMTSFAAPPPSAKKPTTTPYTQRATEVILQRRHGIVPRETLGQGMGPITARAAHLVRALGRFGYARDENLIEVFPKATLQMLWGRKIAAAYKREVETWDTRARVLESLRGKLEFGRRSRLAKEAVLSNDHCFDAVICAYTGYLWASEGWRRPAADDAVFAADGWIWVPPGS